MQTQAPTTSPTAATGPARTGRVWLISVSLAAIAMGAVNMIAQSTGDYHWWAGFIVLPGALIAACAGPLLVRDRGPAFIGYVVACVGSLVFAVGALLMFGAMSDGWPLMITLPCLAVAGTYLWRSTHPLVRGLHRSVALLALVGATLGPTFLLLQAGWVGFGRTQWWGVHMMAAGVVVFANAIELVRHRMVYRLQAITLSVGPAVVTFLLGLRFVRGW
jgi:hypothetical protein